MLIQRDGNVVNKPVDRVGATELKSAIREAVDREATIMTDEFSSYIGLRREFANHQHVNHGGREYARGDVHVNSCESYFALLRETGSREFSSRFEKASWHVL